jgi:uncharacterized protein YprB with RNaseH-like and TPR domain
MRYPLDEKHGYWSYQDWLNCQAVGIMSGLEDARPDDCLFLDIETCEFEDIGIIPFMVGVGWYEADAFVLHQYFLDDPSDEAAMLDSLGEVLDSHRLLVTFNGKKFDVPVLEARYKHNNIPRKLKKKPNLDLLPLARKRWKRSLPSRRLIHLERDVLGITRTEEDVPGALVPSLYQDFLTTGDRTPINHILYHNRFDVLSMVTLAVELGRSLETAQPRYISWLHLLDMGMWMLKHGKTEQGEQNLLRALAMNPPDERTIYIIKQLVDLYVRHERIADAIPLWEQWHSLTDNDPTPALALARYGGDNQRWYEAAYEMAERMPAIPERGVMLMSIQRKMKKDSE